MHLCTRPYLRKKPAHQSCRGQVSQASGPWKTAALPSGITGEPWELEGALTALSVVADAFRETTPTIYMPIQYTSVGGREKLFK